MQFPDTQERVAQHSSAAINASIQEDIEKSIEFYKENPGLIVERLRELDKEWDVERVLETNASSLIIAGSALGFLANKKFFALPLLVGGFLLQHALQGWCPPLPILRRKGYRTTKEIQKERNALENIFRHY